MVQLDHRTKCCILIFRRVAQRTSRSRLSWVVYACHSEKQVLFNWNEVVTGVVVVVVVRVVVAVVVAVIW